MRQLTDNVKLIGNGYFNYYIVGQEEAVLVECGTRAGAALFAREWQQLADKPSIRYILALHAHFDHVCGVPVLKQLFPEATVVASKIGHKLLSKERIVRDLFRNDAIVTKNYLQAGLLDQEPDVSELGSLQVDLAVSEGDRIPLDNGMKLDIIEAPGHSICSIAAYLQEDQVMFVSDAAGTPIEPTTITPVFFQDYNRYVETLQRLQTYPTRLVGVAHGDIPVGDQVTGFYKMALDAAGNAYAMIKSRIENGYSDEEIAEELFAKYIKAGLSYYPVPMMKGSMHLLINSTRTAMENA